MVRNRWAISHHRGMDTWEIIARENKRGLWRGQFVLPERWRKGERLPIPSHYSVAATPSGQPIVAAPPLNHFHGLRRVQLELFG